MDSYNLTDKANSRILKVGIHAKQKLCHYGRYVAKARLFCLKRYVPATGLQCSYFILVTEISVDAKTEISVTGLAQPLV